MEHIANRVEKQELEIMYIKKTLDELVEQNKKQNEQLSKISESIARQEIIFEKIANLEDKHQDALKRVHNRIDAELTNCEKQRKNYENEFKRVDNEIEKLKEAVANKPCVTHDVIKTEIKHINEKLEKHGKIFWWLSTAILTVIIVAIVKSVLK